MEVVNNDPGIVECRADPRRAAILGRVEDAPSKLWDPVRVRDAVPDDRVASEVVIPCQAADPVPRALSRTR